MSRAALWNLIAPRPAGSPWELPAESIAVKIRWFGLVVGVAITGFGAPASERPMLNVILAIGLAFTAIDTAAFRLGRVFLRDFPLGISALEAWFIALLCFAHTGPESPFRFYYLLSLICCAVRYSPRTTVATCVLDLVSFTGLYVVSGPELGSGESYLFTCVTLGWIAWTAAAMARLLKGARDEMAALNAALQQDQALLETRIGERTRELEESQAQVQHGEKMAAFGLLAAGIAHEVGNPLASISGLVQMLERRDHDDYTRTKLRLVTAELLRIQGTLRELVAFSRPASEARGRVNLAEVVQDALRIAKFYQGGSSRRIVARVADEVPGFIAVRDQLVQVVLNLVLNAIDATAKGGSISVEVDAPAPGSVRLVVADDGCGMTPEQLARLSRPYFTTKKHGTGLGLFVSRRLVEAHGGRLEVESEPGLGTRFTVTLLAAELGEVRTVAKPPAVAV